MKSIRQFIANMEISLKVLITLGLFTFGFPILFQSCGKDFTYVPVVGPKGDTGSDGADGRNGVDASPVTVVQLCPGTTTYPSTFVEVAFCIQGNLYATYSANGGFSTQLVPGSYNSSTAGSSCTFVVVEGCTVTN